VATYFPLDYKIQVYENFYLRDIQGHRKWLLNQLSHLVAHTCWVGKLENENEYTVAFVKDIPEEDGYVLIINCKEGFRSYRIPKTCVLPEALQRRKGKALAALEETIEKKLKGSFQMVKEDVEPAFCDELNGIEEMHGVVCINKRGEHTGT
jgi:hypothetical protein